MDEASLVEKYRGKKRKKKIEGRKRKCETNGGVSAFDIPAESDAVCYSQAAPCASVAMQQARNARQQQAAASCNACAARCVAAITGAITQSSSFLVGGLRARLSGGPIHVTSACVQGKGK